MSLAIRSRLTLWYTAVLGLVLAAFAGGFFFLYAHSRLVRLDEELARSEALVAPLVANELREGAGLGEAAHDALEDIEIPGRSLAVFDEGGALLSGQWEGLPRATVDGERGSVRATVETPNGRFRLHQGRHRFGPTTYQVGVAEPLASVDQDLVELRRTLVGSALAALLLALAGGYWIARGALRPVQVMAAEAGRISERTPGVRLGSPNPEDELGGLARAFNDLLARLESALSQQRRFMADASHELRTPVAIARTAIEVTLGRSGRPEEEYRDSLAVMAVQMRRLTGIVEDLFLLARADAAGLPVDQALLYLDELVAEGVKEAQVLAAAKGVSLEGRGPTDLEVQGDERLLRQMLANLLDNAIRHTPTGRRAEVELALRPDAIELSVTDAGPGIPDEERERIFQRFVRLDAARSSNGAGLGLPIARAIAEAHGGTLVLARSDTSGSTFLVRLPRLASPPS